VPGLKCLKAVLGIKPRAKVLIASGDAAEAQVADGLAAGAAGSVAKPFNKSALLGQVGQVLDGNKG